MINEASQWALQEACAALKRIQNKVKAEHDLFMSVNFSSSDFNIDGFADTLLAVITKQGLKPAQLHIEMTERMLMNQPEAAKRTLQQCSDAGMHISIDDFGTGFSSLSYLHYFPINTLKVDRSFVSAMLEDEGSMMLTKSIVLLGKNMGMTIIAEGAETKEEVAALKEMQCEMVQGYYFAKPMAEDDVIEIYKQTPLRRGASYAKLKQL